MRTTLNIDDRLLEEAMRATGLQDKTECVHAALRALIQQQAALSLADAFEQGRVPALRNPPR